LKEDNVTLNAGLANSSISTVDLVAHLGTLLDSENVLIDLRDRVFYSTDIFTRGVTADVVIVPPSVELLSAAVRLCTENRRVVIPRGGGFSYTQGYIPVEAGTVIVDLRQLNRIVEINVEDLYVTVECGCTWVQLYEALKEKGVRTPYFGPMSGYRSTVGGALSQGSFFLGSTQYGTTADTVLGLDVVLADGAILRTGSAAGTNQSSPFFRNYGPDLTGLFLHDAGALGFKARATLKLIPFPKYNRFATFAFETETPAVSALSDVARGGLAAECYIWDPAFGASLRSRNSFSDDIRYLGGVLRSGNLFDGLLNSARLVVAGKEAFDGTAYLLHVTIDDVSDAGAEGKLQLVNAIGIKHGGRAMEPSAPRALRGTPFNDFAPMAEATPQQRNLPTHGIFPHSTLAEVAEKTRKYFDDHKDVMMAHGITCGTIVFAIGAYAVCIEPLMYWSDPQLALHNRLTDQTDIDALAKIPERPAATKAVAELRAGLVALFAQYGAAHCQIGKAYPYRETRSPETYQLLEAIKAAVDPDSLINPGALGLGSRS
jgi:FAD/FMN-containing dehydrogenase